MYPPNGRQSTIEKTPGGGYRWKDTTNANSICGIGYTPVSNPPPFLFTIDVTATNNPTVARNTACGSGPVTDLQATNNPDPPQTTLMRRS